MGNKKQRRPRTADPFSDDVNKRDRPLPDWSLGQPSARQQTVKPEVRQPDSATTGRPKLKRPQA